MRERLTSSTLIVVCLALAPAAARAQQADEDGEADSEIEAASDPELAPDTAPDAAPDAAPAPDTAPDTEPRAEPAPDPRAERAGLHLELATAHFEAGRYDQALLELQTVRELTGRRDLLYNMARCYEAMGREDAAIAHYRRFLEVGAPGEAHDDAVERLAALEGAGQDQDADEAPDALPGAGTLIGLSVGGVGLLTGAIFGILTLVEDASLSDGCGATSSCTGEDLADIRVFRSVADLAFALAAIGGIAGVIGLVIWLGEQGQEGEGGSEASVVLTPWVIPGQGAGASASLRF